MRGTELSSSPHTQYISLTEFDFVCGNGKQTTLEHLKEQNFEKLSLQSLIGAMKNFFP
jgi:hypothetical protein